MKRARGDRMSGFMGERREKKEKAKAKSKLTLIERRDNEG